MKPTLTPKTKARIFFLLKQGHPMIRVAADVGVSRQRVHQLAKKAGLLQETQTARHNYKQSLKSLQEAGLKATLPSRPCAVCGTPAYKRPGKSTHYIGWTCSHECALIWKKKRIKINTEARRRYRLSSAKCRLSKNPNDTWGKKCLQLNGKGWSNHSRKYDIE